MKIKRMAAIILVFSLLAATSTVTNAADEPMTEAITQITEASTSAVTAETTLPVSTVPDEGDNDENAEEYVAEMSICSRASGFPAFFHVWIYIQNISGDTLKIGPYDLPPNEGVSVGTWGMMLFDRWGVYYNMESYASNNRTADDYYALTKSVSAQDIEKISEEITRWDYWDIFFNCTFFATRVWNCIGEKFILPIPLPWIILLQMAINGGGQDDLEMFAPEKERVFKMSGMGENAVLDKVDEHSLGSFVASFDGK